MIFAARQAMAAAARGLAAYHAKACVKCGLWANPATSSSLAPTRKSARAKAGEVIRFYRRYHSLLGKLLPAWSERAT
jgi:hypothetical protein